jgi:hypothetical protein
MTITANLQVAFSAATQFARSAGRFIPVDLARQPIQHHAFNVVGHTGELIWSDDDSLYEFQLESDLGMRGHVICSSSANIPPIIEFGFNSPTLTQSLTSIYSRYAPVTPERSRARFIYLSALEVALEIDAEHGRRYLFPRPWSQPIILDSPLSIRRLPSLYWSPELSESAWRSLSEAAPAAGPIQLHRRPVAYNQNYSLYNGNSKAPNSCIAGCGPVAWAMLESAYAVFSRETGGHDKYAAIHRDKWDWIYAWPSWMEPNPSKSADANERIWAFHSVMGTSCAGATSWSNNHGGLRNFLHHPARHFNSKWGFDNIFAGLPNIPFSELHSRSIARGHPCLLCGTGQFAGLIPFKLSTGSDIGHCVVAYGSDAFYRKLLITMGWGSFFSDRWVDPHTLSSRLAVWCARG